MLTDLYTVGCVFIIKKQRSNTTFPTTKKYLVGYKIKQWAKNGFYL